MDRPLNETHAANIVATVEDMDYQQRLAEPSLGHS